MFCEKVKQVHFEKDKKCLNVTFMLKITVVNIIHVLVRETK